MINKFFADFKGIARICDMRTALRWAGSVALSLPSVLKDRNLLTADRMMGKGPFKVRHAVGSAVLVGDQVFSGLREIWVRDVYARNGFLRIPHNGLVVDLGANMGNFSAMALAANSTTRLIAVEASAEHSAKWHVTMRANNFADRAELCRAFLGNFTEIQRSISDNDPNYADTPEITEDDFLSRFNIDYIDFLKCDIEGSEFFMIEPGSRILDITDRVAIEVHNFGGEAQHFIDALRARGFDNIMVDWFGAECIARAARQRTRSSD